MTCEQSNADRAARQTILLLLDSVWSALDWQDSLWRDPRACWDRFASRVRSASTAGDLGAFVATLARKCHVAVPRLDWRISEALNAADEPRCMRIIARDVELLVGLLRADRAAKKQAKPAVAAASKDRADNPLFAPQVVDISGMVEELAEFDRRPIDGPQETDDE